MSDELSFIVMPAVMYCSQLGVNFNMGTCLKAKVTYNNMHAHVDGFGDITDGMVRVACFLIHPVMQSIYLTS